MAPTKNHWVEERNPVIDVDILGFAPLIPLAYLAKAAARQ